jgi:hypothetical protein
MIFSLLSGAEAVVDGVKGASIPPQLLHWQA